ncbi:MAG TPA: Nif3-like dinuclear metal center hexameric protein [Kineosporiaceae bacterium]|nr:Nif3-like dinuclear metal center hexameric protein [Kineosporiaceae bacterium]
MTDVRIPVVADVIGVLEQMYDPAWARDWDAVGLVCGDPQAPVRRVLLAIDPVAAVVDEALTWHADLLVSHHPLLLRPVHGVAADTAKGRMVHQLIRGGCALYTAHTNADVASPGVSDALARILGLTDLEPLSADPVDPVDKIVTFVPEDHAEKLVDAITAAGAGEVGEYSRVAWTSVGTGSHLAQEVDGEEGAQRRVEAVLPRARRASVIAALRATHPDTQAWFDIYEMAAWSGPRGIGRVGRLGTPTTLREFAMLVAEALPAAHQGVRIAGDPTAEVSRVAVCGGSGDTLFDAVRACGADVFVTADLRHHPASEAREQAGDGTPYLVDVAHWSSEWPWLAGVANRLQGALEAAGTPIEVHVSTKCTDPWTFRVPCPGGVVR